MRSLHCFLLAISLTAAAPQVTAQEWPNRPIKVVVPFAPGGATDLVARVVVRRMSEILGQPMPIENRAGASGNIGVAVVAAAAPDGYTVLVGNVSTNSLNPVMQSRTLKVDPGRDLEPVGGIAAVQNVLVGTNAGTLPPNTFQDFLRYARENPGKLNYSSGGVGSYGHLDMLVLSRAAKLDMVHVPAVAGAGGSTNVQSGLVHTTFLNAANALTGIRAKQLKPLAVTGPKRLAQLPETPTLTELGHPTIGTANWAGMFAPKGTPPALIKRLNQALHQALASPEVLKTYDNNAIDAWGQSSAEEFGMFVSQERERFRRIIQENDVPLL